jgi:hypothetical protein
MNAPKSQKRRGKSRQLSIALLVTLILTAYAGQEVNVFLDDVEIALQKIREIAKEQE